MRKLIFSINLSIDGCCDHAKLSGDKETHEYFIDLLRSADTLAYGRKTWELMVPFWPDMAKNNSGSTKVTNDFAHAFASIEKSLVFSRSSASVEAMNTTIVSSNLEEEIHKLKQQPGKNILTGGVDIPTQLIQLGLVDEYRFVIQPVIVGKGKRFLDTTTLAEKLQLNLIETKVFTSGSVAVRYVKG